MTDRALLHPCFFSLAIAALSLPIASTNTARADDAPIRLIVRGDDIGSSHAANVACIRCYRDGIVRSVEVMVPCPWFPEAVKMLRENPDLDVGVHLDLTAEWEFYKWGPITKSPSLADSAGNFYPMTSQRRDFPPNTGFLEAKPKLEEVERELRAQIELAVAKIENVTHLTCHMGTATATPELRALVERLSREYKLPLGAPGARRAGGLGNNETTLEQMETNLTKVLEGLTPGVWLLVDHPALDTPEMRAIGHLGYRNVAAHREAVTRAFTSQRVKRVIQRRGIELIGYGDLYRSD